MRSHARGTASCLTMIYLESLSAKERAVVKVCLDQRNGFAASAIMQCPGWPEDGTVLIVIDALVLSPDCQAMSLLMYCNLDTDRY